MRPTLVALAVAIASGTLYAETTLDTLVIDSTSETEEQTSDAPRVSTTEGAKTTSADDIQQRQASTLAEALADDAAVIIDEVDGARGSNITIRGQSGNIVNVRVEGAPNSRNQIMHKNSSDRDTVWLNMDMYQTITVIPGAAANTYGNGSTGGVVLLETKDPESILRGGNDVGANLRYNYASNGESNGIGLDVAKRFNDQFAANATLSARSTADYEDGNGDTVENTGAEELSYLVKGVYTPTEAQRLEASVMQNNADTTDTDADAGTQTDETVREQTLSLQYGYNPLNNDLVDFKVRVTQAQSDQESDGGTGTWENTGGVTTTYAEVENTSVLFPTENTMHVIRYGADYTQDDVRMVYDDDNGDPKRVERTIIGGYLSDTVHVGESLQFSGSLRYDDYSANFSGRDFEGDDSLNSKLSTLWKPFENTAARGLGFTALVGSGYRAPAVYEIYGKGFTSEEFSGTDADGDGVYETGNTAGCLATNGGWCVIPNENLKGETSLNSEFGISFERNGVFTSRDHLHTKVNYIHTDIKDKIYNDTLGTLNTSLGTASNGNAYSVRQFINKDEAAVYGWELNTNYDSDFLFAKFSMQDMAGYVVEDDGSKTADTTIVPRSVSATIGTYFNDQKGRVSLEGQHRDGHRYDNSRGTTTYTYDAYTIFNVAAAYQVTENFSVQGRVGNVTNEVYSKSSSSTTISSGEVTEATYAAGRNYKVGLSYRF